MGSPLRIEPKDGEFNPGRLKSIDYAVKAAHERRLQLIVTLVQREAARTARSRAGAGGVLQRARSGRVQGLLHRSGDRYPIQRSTIAALADRGTRLTGVALKDYPTISLRGRTATPAARRHPLGGQGCGRPNECIKVHQVNRQEASTMDNSDSSFSTRARWSTKLPDIVTWEYSSLGCGVQHGN